MLDFDTLVSSDVIEKLKCTLCKNYLSCFPIYISRHMQSVCGRCILPQKNDYIRNECYEAVSQFLKFPCRYKLEGCLEEIFPKQICEHEAICPYRIVKCPTINFTQCRWEGPCPDILEHCQDNHLNTILNNGEFEIDLSLSHECVNLLQCDNVLLIFTRQFNSLNNLLQYSICHFEAKVNLNNYYCEISIESDKGNRLVECHPTNFNESRKHNILLDSLKNRNTNSSMVFGKISIGKTTDQNILSTKDRVNKDLLSQLICSFCSEYAIPPIYQYENDTIRCSECREKCDQRGPTRRKAFVRCVPETRNFNLDKIACLLNYPCKFQKDGCNFVSKPEQIKSHQVFCPYGKHNCPVSEYVGCQWNGCGKDVIIHIQSNHQNMIIGSEKISEYDISCDSTKTDAKTPIFSDNSSFSQSTFNEIPIKHTKALLTASPALYSMQTVPCRTAKIIPEEICEYSEHDVEYNLTPRFTKTTSLSFNSCNSSRTSSLQPHFRKFHFNKANMLDPFSAHYRNYCNSTGTLGKTPISTSAPCSSKHVVNRIQTKSFFHNKSLSGTNDSHDLISFDSCVQVPQVNTGFTFLRCFIIKFSNHLFRLTFSKKEQIIYWTMQVIGEFKDNFKYENEILDKNNVYRKLLVKEACSPFTNKEDLFKNENEYFYVHVDQIQTFLSQQKVISFKVRVFK